VSRRKLSLFAFVLLLVAAFVVVDGIASRRSQAAALRERADEVAVPTVSVIAPTRSGDSATLELPGRIEANARAPYYDRVGGYL
jgi:hypothetical protein